MSQGWIELRFLNTVDHSIWSSYFLLFQVIPLWSLSVLRWLTWFLSTPINWTIPNLRITTWQGWLQLMETKPPPSRNPGSSLWLSTWSYSWMVNCQKTISTSSLLNLPESWLMTWEASTGANTGRMASESMCFQQRQKRMFHMSLLF